MRQNYFEMKLWKSKKLNASSCVPGKASSLCKQYDDIQLEPVTQQTHHQSPANTQNTTTVSGKFVCEV